MKTIKLIFLNIVLEGSKVLLLLLIFTLIGLLIASPFIVWIVDGVFFSTDPLQSWFKPFWFYVLGFGMTVDAVLVAFAILYSPAWCPQLADNLRRSRRDIREQIQKERKIKAKIKDNPDKTGRLSIENNGTN